MIFRERERGEYLDLVSRLLPSLVVVILLCFQWSQIVWCTQSVLTLIEGEPGCQGINPKLLAKTLTPWPRECDRYCQGTPGCLSFTWSPKDSSCQAFDTPVANCYSKKLNVFWIAKTFAQSKEGFESYITLTESNNYGNMEGIKDSPIVEEKDACVKGSATATWSQAKQDCENQGMLLYAPKNPDELASMVECSGMESDFWTGYGKDGDVFRSDRLMILPSDDLLAASDSATDDCLAGDAEGQHTKPLSCGSSLNYICQPEYHSEFCENSGNVATASELVPDSKGVFISNSPCVSRNAETVGEDKIAELGDARPKVVEKCKAVRGMSSCDVYVNDADGYEKCIVVKDNSIENCAAADKFYLCKATIFASSQRVKFDDASEVCSMNGGEIVTPDDIDNPEISNVLKAVSCSWSMTQTSQDDTVIIYESQNGNNPVLRLRTDSNNNKYNFYDVAICKIPTGEAERAK